MILKHNQTPIWERQKTFQKCKSFETKTAYVFARYAIVNVSYHGKHTIEIRKDKTCSTGYKLDKSTHKISNDLLHNLEYSKEELLFILKDLPHLEETLDKLDEVYLTLIDWEWKEPEPEPIINIINSSELSETNDN